MRSSSGRSESSPARSSTTEVSAAARPRSALATMINDVRSGKGPLTATLGAFPRTGNRTTMPAAALQPSRKQRDYPDREQPSSTWHRRGCRLRTHVRRPQPGAASGGAVRRRSAADRGGCRDREDHHARIARRSPGGARRATGADPPAHVQPPRRPRDALARRTRERPPRHRARVGRHVPRRREPPDPAARASARPPARLHGARPGRRGRRDEPAPRGARLRHAGSGGSRARTRWRRSTRGR